jgi:hypothetical protein
MSVVHLFATAEHLGDMAACGAWDPPHMSGSVDDVTCGSCKRSRIYRGVKEGRWTRPAVLQNYRKGQP